ncbi:N-6 DNA methylase [Brachyspira hyodysenteriae]|nr:N-6 DNA methylase [Brachyspira hyodysenteriae]MDA0064140.1 N-6 DNA methylase [Brachyspira hyodysenteriae]
MKNSITIGNDLGEYYTPRHIVKLMVELIQPKFGIKYMILAAVQEVF